MRRRLVVTGLEGQVVRCLIEQAVSSDSFEIIPIGRPELDLSRPEEVARIIAATSPHALISAAAYTAVDQAEMEAEEAHIINGTAVGELAKAASRLDIPIIHLSTDYVFDGSKDGPYIESDPVAPLGVYGHSKLAGEIAVAAATDNHVILRTAWIYSVHGRNFLKTMLRLAETRDVINVVADQVGNPTSAHDIADGILKIAATLLDKPANADLRGVFHMAGVGATSWADFAVWIFASAARLGAPSAEVAGIPSSSYPTPARRPANSQLDCSKLAAAYGIRLPAWQGSTTAVVKRLV